MKRIQGILDDLQLFCRKMLQLRLGHATRVFCAAHVVTPSPVKGRCLRRWAQLPDTGWCEVQCFHGARRSLPLEKLTALIT